MDSTAGEAKTLISVKNIHFRFGYTPVLIDVTFTINSGDFLAIIGPNGSGKTTLLKIILRLLKPSQGKVRIMGKPVEEFEDWPAIGYVPQKATHVDPFFPVSVKEVVAMGLFSSKKISLTVKRKEESAARNQPRPSATSVLCEHVQPSRLEVATSTGRDRHDDRGSPRPSVPS